MLAMISTFQLAAHLTSGPSMKEDTLPLLSRRGSQTLHADPRRVLAQLFLPGQELTSNGRSRADAVVDRVLAMSRRGGIGEPSPASTPPVGHDTAVSRPTFASHYELIAHRVGDPERLSAAQRSLLVAVLHPGAKPSRPRRRLNPSLVPHPDQSDLANGEQRFVMSVRGVGEGHVSSIGFPAGSWGRATPYGWTTRACSRPRAPWSPPRWAEVCGTVLAEAGFDPDRS